jgi:hypothetical protein
MRCEHGDAVCWMKRGDSISWKPSGRQIQWSTKLGARPTCGDESAVFCDAFFVLKEDAIDHAALCVGPFIKLSNETPSQACSSSAFIHSRLESI